MDVFLDGGEKPYKTYTVRRGAAFVPIELDVTGVSFVKILISTHTHYETDCFLGNAYVVPAG